MSEPDRRRIKITVAYRECGDISSNTRCAGILDSELNPSGAIGCELASAIDRVVPNPMAVLAEAINSLADMEGSLPPTVQDELTAADEALILAARKYCRVMSQFAQRYRAVARAAETNGQKG